MESERGTFYAVGVGPGDPELMTRKAVRVLEDCPVLAVPRTPAGDSLALEIAQAGADLTDKEIHFIDFDMSRDEEKRRQAHRRAAEAVSALLDPGTDVDIPVIVEEALDLPGTKVLMKSGRALPQVLEALESRGLLESSAMVQNCGLPGEQAAESLKDAPQSGSYFTTLLVP